MARLSTQEFHVVHWLTHGWETSFQNHVNNCEKSDGIEIAGVPPVSGQPELRIVREPRVVGDFSTRHNSMKVRVLRVPPSRALEGIDLRPYQLREGSVYDLEPQVAKVLIVWKYAEPVSPRRGGSKPKKER